MQQPTLEGIEYGRGNSTPKIVKEGQIVRKFRKEKYSDV